MNLTAAVWSLTFVGLTTLGLARPVWAVSVYFLTFFANPRFWWWGRSLPSLRWNLYAGCIVLGCVILHKLITAQPKGEKPPLPFASKVAIAILLNATFVHYLLAPDRAVSAEAWGHVLKFVLLYFLIVSAVQTRRDFHIILTTLILGAAYIGFEVTINERGEFNDGRLEGVGAPGASKANQLASMVVTILPIIGAVLFVGTKLKKGMTLLGAPLATNLLLLCNSRGAFLGGLAAGGALVGVTKGRSRKRALTALGIAGIGVFVLLGDSRIIERFLTTFADPENRDRSAASRLEFWHAGWLMIQDYPLGSGGAAFKKARGEDYLVKAGVHADQARAVHNGYINEACEWGIQGLALKLLFLGAAAVAGLRTVRRHRDDTDPFTAFLGACLLAALSAFLVTCMFGDRLDAEWGFWVAALLVIHSRLVAVEASDGASAEKNEELQVTPSVMFTR